MDVRSVSSPERVAALQSEFIRRVYNWMGLGLALTAIVAYYTAASPSLTRSFLATN